MNTATTAHRAVLLTRTGDPDALELRDVAMPEPGPGEVLVRVRAAGVAFAQVLMRRGLYAYAPPFPFTPGAEVAGEIVALGDGVEGWTVGDNVTAFIGTGGYAEYAVVRAALLLRVPAELDPVLVAALPMNYVTAHQLLHRAAKVVRGETVLVHGASGGVGTALLELARLAGLRAVGTASPRNLDVVRQLGAIALDYTGGDVAVRARAAAGRPMDVVLDPIGGDNVLESAKALRPGGRLVVYGYSAPGAATPEAQARLRERMAAWNADPDGIRASGYSIGALQRDTPEIVRDDLAAMVALLAQGHIRPRVTAMPLAEAARAHEILEGGRAEGKLVLVP